MIVTERKIEQQTLDCDEREESFNTNASPKQEEYSGSDETFENKEESLTKSLRSSRAQEVVRKSLSSSREQELNNNRTKREESLNEC